MILGVVQFYPLKQLFKVHVFARLYLIAKSWKMFLKAICFWHYDTILVDYGQIIIKPYWQKSEKSRFFAVLFVLFCFFFVTLSLPEVKMQNWENWSQTSVMIFPLIKTWLGSLKEILSIREAEILCTHVGFSMVGSRKLLCKASW